MTALLLVLSEAGAQKAREIRRLTQASRDGRAG